MKGAKIYITTFFCFILCGSSFSQGLDSKVVLISESKSGSEIRMDSDAGQMFLSLSSGDFTLSLNIGSLRTGNMIEDSLLMNTGDQLMIYKGNIGESLIAFIEHQNDEKIYTMFGTLSLNGTAFSNEAQFNPINFAEKYDTKSYRLDFKMIVEAGKLKIKGFENKLTQQIVFEVVAGRLNVVQ